MRVETEAMVWFSRALSRQLQQYASSDAISHTIFLEIDKVFTEYPLVFNIVKHDVLPVVCRVMWMHNVRVRPRG